MLEVETYNPLDKKHLGENVADAMLRSDIYQLRLLPEFEGAGLYAIYYSGDFKPYAPIAAKNSNQNFQLPIYVGKAIPPGARKGGFGLGQNPGRALFKRLKEHTKNLEQVKNLNVDDFFCRFLVVEDIWIPLGENMLITMFAPLWNQWIDGFGNHDPGNGRYNQERSRWDVIHPGRNWAIKCKERVESQDRILIELAGHLRNLYD